MNTIPFRLQPAMRNITLTLRLTGRRRWAARLAIGGALMRLGGWVTGMDVVVSAETKGRGGLNPHEPSA